MNSYTTGDMANGLQIRQVQIFTDGSLIDTMNLYLNGVNSAVQVNYVNAYGQLTKSNYTAPDGTSYGYVYDPSTRSAALRAYP